MDGRRDFKTSRDIRDPQRVEKWRALKLVKYIKMPLEGERKKINAVNVENRLVAAFVTQCEESVEWQHTKSKWFVE
jgi:hypothetical protein